MKVFTLPLPPFMTNCYFAYEEDSGECFIIDSASNAEKIITLIELQELKPKAILLTHGHFDHISACDELREHFGIPLYIHENDADLLTSPILNCSRYLISQDITVKTADRLLKNGDKIKLCKESLSVMHTPGHSKGSCVYIAKDIIFSGDTIFRGTCGRYDLEGGDYISLMESIKKILALDPSLTVYPGHEGKTVIENERRNYRF